MGRLIGKEKSDDELEEHLERLHLETKVLDEEYNKAQKEALIKELRKKYGGGWRKVIGGMKNNDSLKQFANCKFDIV